MIFISNYIIYNGELYHYGVKGMKWGVRRYQNKNGSLTSAGKMRYNDSDTSVTKKVKKDWNELSEQDFRKKYQVSKDIYMKRVRKYGDPYANSPMVKRATKINQEALNNLGRMNTRRIKALDKDINSFKGHENGIFAKNGKMIMSPEDVNKSVSELTALRDKYSKQVTNMVHNLSRDYQVSYDVTSGKYILRLKP